MLCTSEVHVDNQIDALLEFPPNSIKPMQYRKSQMYKSELISN